MKKARLSLVCVAIAGCAHRTAIPAAPAQLASDRPDFLDLQPGWRLHITTPLFGPGAIVESKEAPPGDAITLKATGRFAYDSSYYAILRDPGGALRFEFVAGTVTVDGKPSAEPAGTGWKIDLKNPAAAARLIYLTRLGDSDHNMAVIAAPDTAALDKLTRMINENPGQACISTGESFCAWVPARVAVVAERMTPGARWEPVR